jgi:hypothetical protein
MLGGRGGRRDWISLADVHYLGNCGCGAPGCNPMACRKSGHNGCNDPAPIKAIVPNKLDLKQ